jgi:hypothetical protein
MITKRDLAVGLLAGFLGSVIGISSISVSVAEEVSQGEVLTVCINKKTGALKVANRCSKEERKTVLGGVGPQGAQGEKGETGLTGATGAQGPQGPTGLKGLDGTVSGLRRTTITYLTGSYCGFSSGYASGVSVVTSVRYNSYSQFSPIDVSTTSLRGCSVDVYAP